MKIIFIDGYNIINSWPNLKFEQISDARDKLIDIMHNYGAYERCKVNIVFDAHMVKGSIKKIDNINDNISVIFTKEGETADSYIEKEVHSLGRRYEVYVVTSDSLEQQTIFQRGAVRVPAIEFYNEIQKIERQIGSSSNVNVKVNKNNILDNIDSNVLYKLEKMRRGK